MAALMRMSQLAAIIEPTEGTAATLAQANLLPVLVDAKIATAIAGIKRDLMRGTLTPMAMLPGLKSGTLPFAMEIAGPLSGFPSTRSPLSLPLRAAGMKEADLKRVPIPASWNSGTSIADGATCGSSVPMTGKIWGDYVPGDTHMFVEVLTGSISSGDTVLITNPDTTTASITPNGTPASTVGYRPADRQLSRVSVASITGGTITDGATLVGGTSGAVAICRKASSGAGAQVLQVEMTPNSAAFAGSETITVSGTAITAAVASSPGMTQIQVPSITLGVNHASLVRTAMRGARGNWSADLNNGERGLLHFTMQGPSIEATDTVNFVYPGNSQLTPPVVVGGLFTLDRTFFPAFSAMSFDMGNELALRDDPADSTGAGYRSCVIVNRAPSGSMDPEAVKRAVYDVYDKAWNKTLFRLMARLVSATAGNSFEFQFRKTQFGEIGEGDRRGVMTNSCPMTFSGDPAQGTDTNYGGDEVLIFEW